MDIRQAFVLFSVTFSCYLVLSLTPVYAYMVGEVQDTEKAKFIIDPLLEIVDELEPLNCDSSGHIKFHAYLENVPQFDMKGVEAMVEDVSTTKYYNITSAISCYPQKGLLSNQEITCDINVKEMFSKLPSCPLGKVENNFYLTFEITYVNRDIKVSNEKKIVITRSGIEPDIDVNFHISYPPYPVPEINCLTGSEINIPVVVNHAETVSGDIFWSSGVNGTSLGSNMIDCEKILSMHEDGREDLYMCTLVVPDTIFTACITGSPVTVDVYAGTRDYDMHANFTTILVSEELRLDLSVSDIPKLECQIINETGTCIPKEPQQNVTVRITGNAPSNIKVFETRYKIGKGDITTTYCRKIKHNKFECATFITADALPFPSDKHGTTTKSRELTMFFDVKYLNYYTNISDHTNVTMEGTVIDELINTLEILEKDKDFFDKIADISDDLNKAFKWVNTLQTCCALDKLKEEMEKQEQEGGEEGGESLLMKAVKKFAENFLWGAARKWYAKVLGVLTRFGPGIVSCVAKEAVDDIDEEMERLEDFEDGEINTELEVPTISELLEEHFAACTAQSFWERAMGNVLGWLCSLFIYLTGIGEALCPILTNPVVGKILQALNLLLIVVSLLLQINTYNKALQNLALARERINMQLAVKGIMIGYTDTLAQHMETLATGLSTNAAMFEIMYPSYETVGLLFRSDRSGVLKSGDDICSGDLMTIEYNFEKLNLTEDFRSQLTINPDRGTSPLRFNDLKGTYGPILTDTLLGTDPNGEPPDPSEIYTFKLSYQSKSVDYELYYRNHPCT